MADEPSKHVLLIGLQVQDDALYRQYRAGMTPILKAHGSDFGYDFVVSEVLKSETPEPINRVFTIEFPDAATAERFFSNPEYRVIREKFFDPSVASATSIATFDTTSRPVRRR